MRSSVSVDTTATSKSSSSVLRDGGGALLDGGGHAPRNQQATIPSIWNESSLFSIRSQANPSAARPWSNRTLAQPPRTSFGPRGLPAAIDTGTRVPRPKSGSMTIRSDIVDEARPSKIFQRRGLCRTKNLPKSAGQLAIAQPNAWTPAVLVDELDAFGFECESDKIHHCIPQDPRLIFKLANSYRAYLRFRRESVLTHPEEGARCSALFRADHARTIA